MMSRSRDRLHRLKQFLSAFRNRDSAQSLFRRAHYSALQPGVSSTCNAPGLSADRLIVSRHRMGR
jgi:hypothetical protein